MTAATPGTDRRASNVQRGDETAVDELVPVVYHQLRRLAKRHLAGQRKGHSLQTADLVNEAYLKLVHRPGAEWKNRAHFVAVASRAMRWVLADHARRRAYAKRGGNPIRVSLTERSKARIGGARKSSQSMKR